MDQLLGKVLAIAFLTEVLTNTLNGSRTKSRPPLHPPGRRRNRHRTGLDHRRWRFDHTAYADPRLWAWTTYITGVIISRGANIVHDLAKRSVSQVDFQFLQLLRLNCSGCLKH